MGNERQTWNLSIRGNLKEVTQEWCSANGMKDSELISGLLERHFENMGIPTTLSLEEFVERLKEKSKAQKHKSADLKGSGMAKLKQAMSKQEKSHL
jgi:hypothetical protein